jgi:hypothetical protein
MVMSSSELVRLQVRIAQGVEHRHGRVVEPEDRRRRHQIHVWRTVRLERVVFPTPQQIH